jgi:hypothetical protein
LLTRDFILVFTGAVIGACLTHWAIPPAENEPTPTGPAGHQTRATDSEDAPPLNKSYDSTSNAQIGDVPKVTVPPQEKGATQKKSDGDNPNETNMAKLSPKQFHENKEKLNKFVELRAQAEKMTSRELSGIIENQFYQEEIDPAWANEKEKNILDMFKNNESLGSITPLHVNCRSENCQVALPAASEEQINSLSSKFLNAAAESDVGMNNKLVTSFPDPSTGRLVLYVSDDGNMDLFRTALTDFKEGNQER